MRALVLGLVVFLPNLAWGQTALAWKFKPGDVFVYEVVSKSDEAANVKGQTLKQEVRATWVHRFKVLKVASEIPTLQVTIDRVAVQHVAGTSNIEDKLIEKAKGAILTLTVSPRGEIVSLDGYDKLIDQIAEKRDAMAKTMRQRIPEATVKQWFQDVLVVLPKDSVSAGSRWKRDDPPLILSTMGRLLVTLNAVHNDLDRAGNHLLAGTLAAKYELPSAPADAFRVTGGALTLDKGQWACTFDNERGRVVHQRTSYELRGGLTVDVVGVNTPVDVIARREWTTKLLPRE